MVELVLYGSAIATVYEVDPTYVQRMHTSGMPFIGRDERGGHTLPFFC